MSGYPVTYQAVYPSSIDSPGTAKAGQMPEPFSRAGIALVATARKGVSLVARAVGRS